MALYDINSTFSFLIDLLLRSKLLLCFFINFHVYNDLQRDVNIKDYNVIPYPNPTATEIRITAGIMVKGRMITKLEFDWELCAAAVDTGTV